MSAADALTGLRADLLPSRPPNAVFATFLAVASLGVVPALLWTLRFRDTVESDARALRRVAEWAARRLAPPQAACLAAAAHRVRRRPVLWVVGPLCALAAVYAVSAAVEAAPLTVPGWSALMGVTYGFQWPAVLHDEPGANGPLIVIGFAGWTVGIAAAYLAHLLQVHLHAQAVRRFLDEFNRLIAVEEGYPPVLLDPIGFGFSPLWMLSVAALVSLSGWWGIAFGIAGATDRRYRCKASVRMRRDLAARVRDVIFASPELSRPVVRVPVDAVRCATPGCGGPLGAEAKFCPRCGARRGRSVDRAA